MSAAANSNSNNTYTTDYEAAARVYTEAHADQSVLDWVQRLAIPAAQAAAQIAILQYQKSQYDDIEERRIGYLDAAVEEWCKCVDSLLGDIRDATDDVPEPAMYQPVSPAGEQFDTVQNNKEMMAHVSEYSKMISKNHVEHDLARAVILNPKYYIMSEITWCSIHDLMKGELPIGLTVQSLTQSAGQNFKSGRLGRHCGQYRRNLGILDYQVQKSARAEQREERASQASHISNLARQGDIREMMQSPQQRIGYALQQGQLIQNSLQNAYNACARKAPYLQQQVAVKLQKCQQQLQLLAGKASLVNSFVPDFASVLNNQIRDFTNGLFSGFNTGNNTAGVNATGVGGVGGNGSFGTYGSTYGPVGGGKNG